MDWFTSDWHLGEDRIGVNGKPNLFYRPFTSVHQQNKTIVDGITNSGFEDGDTLYHLGDVFFNFNQDSIQAMRVIRNSFPNSRFHLVIGNYDQDNLNWLLPFFQTMTQDLTIDIAPLCYLNHYPSKCMELMQDAQLGITGHIHGLWKVQKHLINVGVDAWHFKPVSEETIRFCFNAMQNHYDENVFISS